MVAVHLSVCHCRAVVFSRSRRQLAALDKDGQQYGFPPDVGEEPPDLDPALSYYQLDDGADAVFTPMLVRMLAVSIASNLKDLETQINFVFVMFFCFFLSFLTAGLFKQHEHGTFITKSLRKHCTMKSLTPDLTCKLAKLLWCLLDSVKTVD